LNLVFWNISLFLQFSLTLYFQFEFIFGIFIIFFSPPSFSFYLFCSYSFFKIRLRRRAPSHVSICNWPSHVSICNWPSHVSICNWFLGCLIVNVTHFYFHFRTPKTEYCTGTELSWYHCWCVHRRRGWMRSEYDILAEGWKGLENKYFLKVCYGVSHLILLFFFHYYISLF